MKIPDFDRLAREQPAQITPFLIELNGHVQVRNEGATRILEVIHPSGVIAARITLDPVNAASVARQLSPPVDERPATVDL